MEKYLEEMFKHLNVAYKGLESRLKAEGFKARILQVLKAWDEWLVYDRDFLGKLRSSFLGIPNVRIRFIFFFSFFYLLIDVGNIRIIELTQLQTIEKHAEPEPSLGSDGEKDDEDLDGVPLDGAALLKSAYMRGIPGAASNTTDSPAHDKNARTQESHADSDYDDDIDGVPRKKLAFVTALYEVFTGQNVKKKF